MSGEQTHYEATISGSTGGNRTITWLTLRTIIPWALLSLLNKFYLVIKVHLMYLKDIIRGGISMKKLYLFIIPIISYILAYIITDSEYNGIWSSKPVIIYANI